MFDDLLCLDELSIINTHVLLWGSNNLSNNLYRKKSPGQNFVSIRWKDIPDQFIQNKSIFYRVY